MPRSETSKLDSKGRVVIPNAFREMLLLHPEDTVLVSLDEENNRITIAPATEKGMAILEIELSDAPGALAKAAQVLAHAKVDLVSTESHSTSRGKRALWRVVCNAASAKNFETLKRELANAGALGAKLKKL